MRQIKNQKGYTVTEMLIVVAITGTLFVTTAAMIKGQIDKYSYQDSMRQLQQMAQQVVRDTENGYFPGAAGNDSASVYMGKRVTFCGGNSATVTDGCTDRTQMRVQNMRNGVTPVGTEQLYNLPGGLRFIGSYEWNNLTTPNKQTTSTGYMTRFSLLNGNGIGSDCSGNVFCAGITDAQQSIGIATYSGAELAAPTAVCFEGYRKGSLVFGLDGSTAVAMNLDDPNCYSGY
jgi:prepilin-type N-terminal cleavage/methylation domain-containing protein